MLVPMKSVSLASGIIRSGYSIWNEDWSLLGTLMK